MALFLRSTAPLVPVTLPASEVLCEWLRTVTAFQESYHRLNQSMFIASNNGWSRFALDHSVRYQAAQLLAQMRHELNALVNELECPQERTSLSAHTARLRPLISQAGVLLNLLVQSSC